MSIHVAILDCHIPSVHWLESVLVAQYVWTPSASTCSHGLEIASILASNQPACESPSRNQVQLHSHAIVSTSGELESKYVIRALQQIEREGRVHIVNLSWGALDAYNDSAVHEIMQRMSEQQGIVFVAAAGNSGPDAETIVAPAHLPFVIAVGALESTAPKLRLLFQSSRGPPPTHAQVGAIVKPDCVATVPRIMRWDNQCVQLSGTSYAAPHVVSMLVCAMFEAKLRKQRLFAGAWLQIIHVAGTPLHSFAGWQQGSGTVTYETVLRATLAHIPHVSIWPPRIALNITNRDVVAIHSFQPYTCVNKTDATKFAQVKQISYRSRMHHIVNSSLMSINVRSGCGDGVLQVRSLQAQTILSPELEHAHASHHFAFLWIGFVGAILAITLRKLRFQHQHRKD